MNTFIHECTARWKYIVGSTLVFHFYTEIFVHDYLALCDSDNAKMPVLDSKCIPAGHPWVEYWH